MKFVWTIVDVLEIGEFGVLAQRLAVAVEEAVVARIAGEGGRVPVRIDNVEAAATRAKLELGVVGQVGEALGARVAVGLAVRLAKQWTVHVLLHYLGYMDYLFHGIGLGHSHNLFDNLLDGHVNDLFDGDMDDLFYGDMDDLFHFVRLGHFFHYSFNVIMMMMVVMMFYFTSILTILRVLRVGRGRRAVLRFLGVFRILRLVALLVGRSVIVLAVLLIAVLVARVLLFDILCTGHLQAHIVLGLVDQTDANSLSAAPFYRLNDDALRGRTYFLVNVTGHLHQVAAYGTGIFLDQLRFDNAQRVTTATIRR